MNAIAKNGYSPWAEHSESVIGTFEEEEFEALLLRLTEGVKRKVGSGCKIAISIRTSQGTPMLVVRGEAGAANDHFPD